MNRIVRIAAGLLVLGAVGTGGGIWLASHHHPVLAGGSPHDSAQARRPSAPVSGASQSPAGPASPASTGSSSPTASVSPSASGAIDVGAAAAASPEEPAVVALLNEYFTAVNSRDYQSYVGLLAPDMQTLSRRQFKRGYRTTVDSNERLLSITAASNGAVVGKVAFISHQDPADSVNGREACTSWRISMFLRPTGGSYLIGRPPPGYHASYAPC